MITSLPPMITLKPTTQFPFLSPPNNKNRPNPTEIRFSRWNNANAEKFNTQETTQKQLEDKIRFHKRFNSAQKITHNYNPAPPHLTSKSTGTPSTPSLPSIPGKKSKYSKPNNPAFTPLTKTRPINTTPVTPNFKVDENGVSYQLPDAPFLYQYSYTETPKVKPVKLREPLVSPFGPETMKKPWMGRKPMPGSKKSLPEFDSFKLPPANKKGVKPVQAPGPYLPGSGPKYVMDRDAVLGEPLTKDEAEELVKGSRKSNRQLNMGRDGLTHNMLDNIHALWKRRRVCKIRCLGVCTVDMENVCRQLEEKSGGKIIHCRGGVIYLFRGRNYNYNSRPRYPLMLWKPVTPVYPRLVKRAPEGLSVEEATEMRRKGRDLAPICKLGKNGVYCDLVKNIKEAFEACELVRINCQGLNPSDYRKIGAKLKDLVPCVLISFEDEHILIWRGREWKSSLPDFEESPKLLEEKVEGDDALRQSDSFSIGPRLSESSSNNAEVSSTLTHGNGELVGPADQTEIGNKKMLLVIPEQDDQLIHAKEINEPVRSNSDAACCEGVLLLKKEAVENGMAIVLEDDSLDADIVLMKVIAFSETAPVGPAFRHMRKKQLAVEKIEEEEQEKRESPVLKVEEAKGDLRMAFSNSDKGAERKTSREKKLRDIKVEFSNVVPEGDLRVDELAKLLA